MAKVLLSNGIVVDAIVWDKVKVLYGIDPEEGPIYKDGIIPCNKQGLCPVCSTQYSTHGVLPTGSIICPGMLLCKDKDVLFPFPSGNTISLEPGYKIVCIDFDGCICADGWPDIEKGRLIHTTVQRMMEEITKQPTVFILWTCRDGQEMTDAKKFIKKYDLPIYLFNENLSDIRSWYQGYYSRKIFAHEYWDDRAVNVKEVLV